MSVVIAIIAPRLLAPALMVAFAIIVRGYTDAGDGFSAAVIVTLAIGLRYIALGVDEAENTLPILRRAPLIALAGLVIALASGFFPVVNGDPPFTHAPGRGEPVQHLGTLELSTAVAFDVGLFLLVTGALVALIHYLGRLLQQDDA